MEAIGRPEGIMEPTFFFAPGAGLVSSRSDWSKDAVQLVFCCGPTLESHQDRNQGHFGLFFGDWLAAMAKLMTHSGIAQGVEDSNCTSFGNLKQSWTQDQAKIIIQENTDTYSFLVGDLTGAYAPGDIPTVGHYTRALFFMKPNFLLVRDEFTLINTSNTPVFHLHTLGQPVIDLTGFVAVSPSAGTKLFGTATSTPTASAQRQTPDQVPTWRLDFPADATGGFCVALETAPASQSARTVTSFISAGLRGAGLGNSMVAFVTGDLPLTYTAPVAGTHSLLGLKPNTTYRVPGVVSQSTQAGVLSFRVPAIGSLCTISESSSPPPPPPPVPVISSVQDASHTPITHAFDGTPAFITGTGFGVVSGSVTVAGLPASVTAWTSTQIGVTLPKLPAQFALEQTGPVVVTTPSGVGTSAFAFTLTSSAPPPPPPPIKKRTFTVVIPETGAPSIVEVTN